MNKNVCIIPARQGSTRLKNKNFKLFKNKKLIEHTIISAIKSKLFDKIILSSDSNKILALSKKYSITPFFRDKFADNFIPNQGIEALIGNKYRAVNIPKLSSPPVDTTLSLADTFLFKGTNPEGEKLDLQVLNNKGIIIEHHRDIIDLNLSIDLPSVPGLYYWKLSGEEELYIVGRIILKADLN